MTTTGRATTPAPSVSTAPQSTTTETTGGGYAAWLPTPQTLGMNDMYRVTGARFPPIRTHETHISDEVYSLFETGLAGVVNPTGIGFEALQWMIGFENIWVAEGSGTASDVATSIENTGFTEEKTIGEFTVYSEPNGNRRVGVKGSTVALNRRRQNDTWAGTIEQAIKTRRGRSPRLVEENPYARDLVDTFDEWSVLSIALGPASDPTKITGATVSIDGETSTVSSVAVYENPDAIDESKVEAQASQYGEKAGVEATSYRIDGRVAVVEITAVTASYGSELMQTFVS